MQVARENGRDLPDFQLKPFTSSTRSAVTDILKPELRRKTILLWVIWFFISFGYYGVFTWLPNYFKAQGMALLPVY